MKKTIILIVFVALAALASAQYHSYYSTTLQPSTQAVESNKSAVFTGSYTIPTSTIYEPFSDETPSSGRGPSRAPGGPGVTGEDQDYGDPTINPNPIGEPVLPLALIAIAFAAFAYIRARKRARSL